MKVAAETVRLQCPKCTTEFAQPAHELTSGCPTCGNKYGLTAVGSPVFATVETDSPTTQRSIFGLVLVSAGALGLIWAAAMLFWNASNGDRAAPIWANPIFWFGLVALFIGLRALNGSARKSTGGKPIAPITPASSAAAGHQDPEARLAKLNDLVKKGLLTQGEYETKRQDVLDRL